jgi:PPK2 family polyphosphate:nucleotide phosphotransferase
MIKKETIDLFRVKPGTTVRLKDHDPAWTGTEAMKQLGKDELKDIARKILKENIQELADAQELLYAGDRHSVLIIVQAMDAAGKDGLVEHVMSGVNPQGCQVFSFKQPSAEELDHNFLWRCSKALPERGRIGIFNRSYYEEVLIVRVHPEMLERQRLPPGKRNEKFWRKRYDDINAFEHHLVRNGTVILKFFLNVSKGEQKKRFLERLDTPEKNWKFSEADVAERKYWKEYMRAYEAAISETSTKWAPWYILPADNKLVTRALAADIITSTIRGLKLKPPAVSPERRKALEAARQALLAED